MKLSSGLVRRHFMAVSGWSTVMNTCPEIVQQGFYIYAFSILIKTRVILYFALVNNCRLAFCSNYFMPCSTSVKICLCLSFFKSLALLKKKHDLNVMNVIVIVLPDPLLLINTYHVLQVVHNNHFFIYVFIPFSWQKQARNALRTNIMVLYMCQGSKLPVIG